MKVLKKGTGIKSREVRLNVFIDEKHSELIEALIRKRPGVTKKDIVYSALDAFFNPDIDEDDHKQVLSELQRVRKEQLRHKFTTETLLDAFSIFVKIWMCHTNEIPREHEEAAAVSMNRRFRKFTQLVLEEIKTGANPLLTEEVQ